MIKFVAMTLDIYDFLQLLLWGPEDVITFGAGGLAAASIAAQALTNLLGTRGRKKEAKRMMRQGEKQFDEYTQKLLDLGAQEQKVDQAFTILKTPSEELTKRHETVPKTKPTGRSVCCSRRRRQPKVCSQCY